MATWPGLGPAKDPRAKGGTAMLHECTDFGFTTIGQVGSVPLRGTSRLIAKEDGNGEPDPVSYVNEAVHFDGADQSLLYFLSDILWYGTT